jgi:TPR repeat protein
MKKFFLLLLTFSLGWSAPAVRAQGGRGFTSEDLQLQQRHWLGKAAAGDMEAQFVVGDSYLNGRLGLAKDGQQAAYWLEKAAAQQHLDAQFEVGKLYYFGGQGLTADGQKAVKWLSAAQAHLKPKDRTLAQLLIATCYTTAMGVPKNDAEAVKWFRHAAENGSALGAYRLGVCYAEGLGVPADDRAAAAWFRTAALAGERDAQARLGLAYRHGRGVPQDYVEAYRWLDRAASKGNDQALQSRQLLRAIMTPQQLAEAQKSSEPAGQFRFSDVTIKQ